MKPSVCRLLVASSWILLVSAAGGVTRPRYGGSLRVELEVARLLAASSGRSGDARADLPAQLERLVYERLVRLDGGGQPQPELAIAWERDPQSTVWRLRLRPGVKWHDGSPLTANDAATALASLIPEARLRAEGDTLEIDAGDRSLNLLVNLATSPDALVRRAVEPAGGLPVGSGPFRVTEWQPGRRAILQANEDYWGGRPYLDRLEFQIGRSSREELIDLELDRADLVELDPAEARRAQQEGRKVWASAPVELLWLGFNPDSPAARDRRLREAIALSIDRGPIQRVLVQNYGEVTGAILPQWLSGYAFLFATAADLDRARKLKAEIGSPPALRLGYDPGDILSRQVAERIAVNARDTGITLEVVPLPPNARRMAGNAFDAQVARIRIGGPTVGDALAQALAGLSFSTHGKDNPEEVYAAEQEFLDSFSVVPLVYVPELVGLGSQVRNWSATRWGDWRLDEVWLEGRP